MQTKPPPPGRPGRFGSPFDRLGRAVVRHPWYPVLLWVAVLLVAIPAVASLGSVISNSFGNVIPASDESVVAQHELAVQFPNSTGSSTSALVLLELPSITGPTGRNATLALTRTLSSDPKLEYVHSVESLYTAYAGYLAGQAELGLAFLEPALRASPSLPGTVNLTASLVWGPVRTFVQNWQSAVQQLPSNASAHEANWLAFNATRAEIISSPVAEQVLTTFYNGVNATVPGFNLTVTLSCLESHNITPCADNSTRSTLGSLVPTIFPGAANETVALAVLESLAVENLSCWSCVQEAGARVLGNEVGLAPGWVDTLWQAFPSAVSPSVEAVANWATTVAEASPPPGYLLPMPASLRASFVDSSGSASLIIVTYSVSDSFTANGSTPTFRDDAEISTDVSHVLSSSVAFAQISYYVTGGSPVTSAISYLATSALSVLLLLTIIVLIAIMIIYFRAPAAPLVSFGAIGIALVVSLGIVFVLGKFVTPFNPEVEPVLLVFLMSIGTDYSVFLMARYREELVKGASPSDAVRTTVRWAGQSITTSGLTVAVVTAAMTFTGIGMMTQFGLALTFGVLTALAVALTIVPSILLLVGPRIFWPYTGERFRSYAARRRRAVDADQGYIAKAGRTATRRPWAVIGAVLLLSSPVIVVALQVPVSYDISNIGLPTSNPAQQGFNALNDEFGPGYASPSYLLVTFSSPLLSGNQTNTTEFRDVAALTSLVASAPGVDVVSALTGGSGAPLSFWENYSHLLPAQQEAAKGMMSEFVGADGRTVLFQVTTNSSGYSAAAMAVMDTARARVSDYVSGHPEVTQVSYGGAAQTTEDLRALIDQTTEDMLIGAAVGLFVMLLVILGSAFVPALALGAIGLSILWGWAGTYFVVGIVEGEVLMFLLPLLLLILILGLGMDYNVLLLTRVREERAKGGRPEEAVRRAVTNAGGVIAAAAVILGGAFLLLGLTSPLAMLAGIGLGIGIAVLLQAFVVQTYLTPAVLALGKDWIWRGWARARPSEPGAARDP